MADFKIDFIVKEDLPDVCKFLHANMNDLISPEQWRSALTMNWHTDRPNYGALARAAEGGIVGVFAATYSQQTIKGRNEQFCNLNSWCVLDQYRSSSMGLLLKLIKQKGFIYTDFTPNDTALNAMKLFKFKELPDALTIYPCIPFGLRSIANNRFKALDDYSSIAKNIDKAPIRKIFNAHKESDSNRFVLFKNGSTQCLIAFQLTRFKRVRCARITYICSSTGFNMCLKDIKGFLLSRYRCFVLSVESRFVDFDKPLSYKTTASQVKLVRGSTIDHRDVQNLYSELFCLGEFSGS